MKKTLFIAEKPSVAEAFSKALKLKASKKDGYYEGENTYVTWCVGHLVTMSYPDAYDEKLKKWSFDTLPFIPDEFLYEVIPSAKKQYHIVSRLLNDKDVEAIYVCTDSGREGEYIYRLVDRMAGCPDKEKRRVWIDSQTDEEIRRGIKEAKPLSEYDRLSDAAYLRAKEDYLMGINFSRVLTLKYGNTLSNILKKKHTTISVGRVMTCVLGMVTRRERQIRAFVKTPFYKIMAELEGMEKNAQWKVTEGSSCMGRGDLYKEEGFLDEKGAADFIEGFGWEYPLKGRVAQFSKKTEKKKPPLLYNLAELQNACSKRYKIPPDRTLQIAQTLYEKKLTTYPRTDARVLSSAVAKEIKKNIKGLCNADYASDIPEIAGRILNENLTGSLAKTQYVNDSKITDHYAIIPTGNIRALKGLDDMSLGVYDMIVRRFLSIFYPAAVYRKITLSVDIERPQGSGYWENFSLSTKVLEDKGFMEVTGIYKTKDEDEQDVCGLMEALKGIRKGSVINVVSMSIKKGETSPPKRYTSGSMILAMENAGNLIEDEDLRSQIKGAGIGTSATRAAILTKLVSNKYLSLNKKTQTLTPTHLGEMIFDTVSCSIPSLLNPELTASWEKGLSYVEHGEITTGEYMEKLSAYITKYTELVKNSSDMNVRRILMENDAHDHV